MGFIIVIEGTDGSGKKTQTQKLFERLKEDGKNVMAHAFPSYESESSGPVKMYLGGELGKTADEIDAFQASSLFAVDRFCTMKRFKEHLDNGGILLLDRYIQANMVHQAGKAKTEKEREEILKFIEDFEFNVLKLPRADLVFFLDVPVEISKRLANERTDLKTGKKQDIHEADQSHLENAYKSAKIVAKKYGWHTIDCTDEQKNILPIDVIANIIYNEAIKCLK